MNQQDAINALKRKDYATARALMARENMDTFDIQSFIIKGISEIYLSDWREAALTFAKACQRFPAHADFWQNLGMAQENMGTAPQAIASYEQALALNPSLAAVCGNLSNLYRQQQRFDEAATMARRALALGADKSNALNSLGLALARQGLIQPAIDAYRQALAEEPQNADALVNLANMQVDQLAFDAAWPLFAQARTLNDTPERRHEEGLARLLAGDEETGGPLFEARLELRGALRTHAPCPLWRGENLEGKRLLIHAEQGFGDVIQFCRFGQFIKDGDLIWAVPPSLTRLLSGAVRGQVIDERGDIPACDYNIPMMSLPFVLKQSYFTPATTAYLRAPETPALPHAGNRQKIGLIWAGSRSHHRDRERSLALNAFDPLLQEISADYYAPVLAPLAQEIGDRPIIHLHTMISDFADSAALLKQMDIVISVDTATAHLAGALGVETYILLPYCPDWRWGTGGAQSQLYPHATLLRQKEPGQWGPVIHELIERLKARTRS